jgi:hypothetical protein
MSTTNSLKKLEEIKKRVDGTKTSGSNNTSKSPKLSTLDRIKAKVDGTYDGEISFDTVRSWLSDAESTIKDYNKYFTANEGKWTENYGADFTSRIAKLKNESDSVAYYLRSHRNDSEYFDEIYKGFNSYLSALDEFEKNNSSMRDIYSQYDSADSYNKAVSGWLNDEASTNADTVALRNEIYQSNIDKIAEIDKKIDELGWTLFTDEHSEKKALKAEKEALEAENRQYEITQKKLDDYWQEPTEEFLKNAAYREYDNPTLSELDQYSLALGDQDLAIENGWKIIDGHWRDKDGNIVNINFDQEEPVIEDKLAFYNANRNGNEEGIASRYAFNIVYDIVSEGRDANWELLNKDETNIYYNLLKTEGQESAYRYLDAMKPILNKRATEDMAKEISEAEGLEQVFNNILSIPTSVIGGASAFVDDTINILQGDDINPYSSAHRWQNYAQLVREDTAKDINALTGNASLPLTGFTFGDLYQSLMSAADSTVGIAIGGNAYGVLMGMGAASSEMKRLYEQGASTGQMIAGGLLAGAAEMVFEKISIESLLKNKGNAKSIIFNFLKQGGIEAFEEMATEIANTITNVIVMGSQSDWVDVGTFVKNVVNAGIGGFVSGGTMGGTYATINKSINKAKTDKIIKEHGASIIDQGGTDALKQLALEMYSNQSGIDATRGVRLASKVADKATAKNVGKLSAHMGETNVKQNKADIASALESKGMSKTEAKATAEIITKADNNVELTKAEQKKYDKLKEDGTLDAVLEESSKTIGEREINLLAARLGRDVKNPDIKANSNKIALKNEVSVKDRVSESGKTTVVSSGESVTINKDNAIKMTKVEDGKRVIYYNTDHGVVKSTDVKYGSESEGLVYEAFADMNPAVANALIKNYDGSVPLQTYITGMRQGVLVYGMHNFQGVGIDISKNSMLADLSDTDQAFALKLGKSYAKSETARETNALKRVIKNASNRAESTEASSSSDSTKGKVGKGKVSFENGAKAKTRSQKHAVSLAKHLASAIGIDIVFYDATTDRTWKGKSNGFFDEETNTIHLDLQNATTDSKTIAFTMSHELVHFIKKWSPSKFKTFADFLVEQYAAHGVSTSKLLANKMAELDTTDADFAFEEMIADACETMLLDSNAVVKLMELRKADLELFEKIKLHIYELLNKIREEYRKLNLAPTSDEAKALLKMEDVLEKFHSLFEEAAVDATQNYQAVQNANKTVFGEASVDVGTTESGIKHQLKAHKAIGEASIAYNERHKIVHNAILQVGVESMYEMAEAMLPYLEEEGILPPDIPGKTIFNNGSYGRTGENTTLCVRTLTYEDFKDRVAEKVGRPLTVSESLLVSQKIYDIATEPQCIYCYVAADRKAYDEYLGEYWKAMDKYIKALRNGGDSQALYIEYLAGRKDTNQQKKRWSQWEAIAKSGKEYISAKDLTTKRNRDGIIARKNAFSDQVKDAQRYAQSASWAKTVCDYRAYKGDILKMTSKFVDMLNSEYGLRMYSFSDYTPAFIVENMQMIIDASVKGLKSLAYTKDTDYVEIFASTGQAINVSCFAKWDAESGTYVEDNRQGANWENTKNLRKQYPNVGAVMVATNDAMVEWALKQDWVDVVIPYHIVKTGTTIANEYQWNNYTSESSDRVGNKTANIYPTEHNNDFTTYNNLLKERGITPRFSRWYDKVASGELTEEQYMKLVNEVRLPASELSPVVPSFNLEAAKKSFGIDNDGNVIKGGFVDKGGYMGGWYRQGVDVNQEVMAVSEDIEAGLSSLDVDYGMSKTAKERVEQRYKKQVKRVVGESGRYYGIGVYLDSTLLTNLTDEERIQMVKEYVKELGDSDFIAYDPNYDMVSVHIANANQRFKNNNGKNVPVNKDLTSYLGNTIKQESIALIDELILTSTLNTKEPSRYSHDWLDNYGKNDWEYWITYVIDKNNTIWEATLNIATNTNGEKILYDIVPIKMVEQSVTSDTSTTKNRISQNKPIVKKNSENSQKNSNEHQQNPTQLTKKDSVLYEGQPKFQKKKVSNRTILANALESTIDTSTQEGQYTLDKLNEYMGIIGNIEMLESKRHEIVVKAQELQRKKGKTADEIKQMKDLWLESKKIANRINTYDGQLLRIEAMKPIQKLLYREKKKSYQEAQEKGREALNAVKERQAKTTRELMSRYQDSRKKAVEKVRETRDKNEAKDKLQKLILKTIKWLSYPKKEDVKCPDILKEPYAEFLNSIDLSSKRLLNGGDPTQNDMRFASAMDSLATAIEKIKTAQNPNITTDQILDSGYLDLPENFVENLRNKAEEIKGMMTSGNPVVNDMHSKDVKAITKLIRTLNHAIKEMSTLYANLRFANVQELGHHSISFLESMGEADSTNGVKDFVEWDNALPYYAFRRFGEGGESIFEGLMDAQDKLARLAKVIFDFKDKTWTDKEADEWGKDTHTITLPSENTITLTTADAMSIYCLSRRDNNQGLNHLLGGGVRVIGLKKGAKKAGDSRSTLTYEDVLAIISSLTDRQKSVAEAIQGFMSSVCSDWGNEISMKRFLTNEFNEKVYFPIESNDENLDTKDPKAQQSDLYRLLNISATKPITPGANNEVIIRNIFDVFTNHSSDMARLNSFGMALLDYMKWLNYREKSINDENGQITVRGVRKAMGRAYGEKAKSYVINLIKDINGRHNDNGDNPFLMSMMRMAKTASVGNNLRVAFLQFTSYPRASMVLSTSSLAKGLTKVPQIEKAKKYCGIALWKSFGFYDTNIARSIEDQIKGATNIRQKIIELSMKTPELADAITWGALWNACEYEVAKTTKNKVGSEEFYQEVGNKLREVVYATQVVDSVLTRSQIMRSKSGLTQTATAYMSEPTLTANILMDAGFEFQKEKRITGSAKTAWKKTGKIVGRAVANYCILQLLTSLAESLADAWRDDDDEEFGEKFSEAFKENLITNIIPFNKLPIISDIAELILSLFGIGFVSSDNMATYWITQIADALYVWAEVLGEEFGGKETSKTMYNAIYKTTKAISSLTGISISGAMREVVTLWNNTAGAYDSTLKIRSYESTNAELGQELYEAIVEGDNRQAESLKAQFDDSKAIESALRKALRENDPRIKEAAEASYNGNTSEYSRIFDEIVAEGNFDLEDIKKAIGSEVNVLEDADEEESDKKDTEESVEKPKAVSKYNKSDVNKALDNGDTNTARKIIDDLVKTEVANGKTEKEAKSSIRASMTSYWKPLFLEGDSVERGRIRKILKSSGVYGSTDDVIKTTRKWLED